ncbi:cysteine-rich receptor protein kinase [Trifolium repens]|nr:cysteine-rich receptor protein kinase [Trifolium repens]
MKTTKHNLYLSPSPFNLLIATEVFSAVCFISKRVWKKRDSAQEPKTETDINTVESLRFDLSALEEATNKFSEANKLGEGGFGEVYKISRLLANLPHFGVALMTADRKVGLTSSSVFPHLVTQDAGTQTSIDSFYEYLLKAYLLFGDEEYL